MKVIAWNMGHDARCWPPLDALKPDIALLTETPRDSPRERVVGETKTIGRDERERPWSAVVWSKYPIIPITDAHSSNFRGAVKRARFETDRPGAWSAATVTVPDFGDVTVISLYGLLDEVSDASVHRSLSEIAPIFDDSRWNQHILLGGDLNTATQWLSNTPWLVRDRIVLERIAAFGLVDCLLAKRSPGRLEGCPCEYGDDCAHTRTRLDNRWPNTPYQTDYLFATRDLAQRLSACEAVAEARSYSDHFPLIATFEPSA
jgi:endonuclease/exonuclease/phosphatase family metal-dependent hydrolase